MLRAISNRRLFDLCIGLVAVGVMAGGCAFTMPTPKNFVKVDSSWSTIRALTPDEDKLLVRHFWVAQKAEYDFWVKAARNQYVQERGYTLIQEGDFETDKGLTGHRFLFEIPMNEVPYRHEVVVFFTKGWVFQHVYAAMFLCQRQNYEKSAEAVESALKQFRAHWGRPLKPESPAAEAASE